MFCCLRNNDVSSDDDSTSYRPDLDMEQQPTSDAEQAAKECVTELIQRSAEFHQRIGFERDGLENRVDLLAVEHGCGAVAAHINGVHPIVHAQVMDLLNNVM